jgi:BMFP domain-containing protein YqiC
VAIKDIRANLKRIKDADPIELASQVNDWIHESGEAVRLKIEDEVERAVTKRGFVKRSEFLKLEARIAELEGKKSKAGKSKASNKAGNKASAKKRASSKVVKGKSGRKAK